MKNLINRIIFCLLITVNCSLITVSPPLPAGFEYLQIFPARKDKNGAYHLYTTVMSKGYQYAVRVSNKGVIANLYNRDKQLILSNLSGQKVNTGWTFTSEKTNIYYLEIKCGNGGVRCGTLDLGIKRRDTHKKD